MTRVTRAGGWREGMAWEGGGLDATDVKRAPKPRAVAKLLVPANGRHRCRHCRVARHCRRRMAALSATAAAA